MKAERTEKSILNVESNFFLYAFRSVMMFIVRTFFIKVLGKDVLGLDGLYTNILLVLSITELGISNAINFSLYKPLSQKDYDKVSVLMSFYKKIYRIIGFIIIVLGLLILPFLGKIIVEAPNNLNIYIIFLLYLFDTANLYFISYKETLILADQNNYLLTRTNFVFYLLMYLLQIGGLIFFKSYILYIVIRIIVSLVQRFAINKFISQKYQMISFNSKKKVNDKDLKIIKTNVKGLVFHRVGNYVINGTDNIIISAFLNLATVGMYTNYLSITMMSNSLLASSYKAITASFGNLIAMEDKGMQEQVFQKINFAGHLLYGFVTIAFIVLINKFVEIWLGSDYLLSQITITVICINFYLDGMKQCIDSIKDAAGVYDQDKYVPILQAIVNIAVSLILVKPLGVLGIVLGTCVSHIVLPVWNRPYIIYKHVFNTSPKNYYINYVKNIMVLVITTFLIYYVIGLLKFKLNILTFIVYCIIYSILYLVIISIIYFKNANYRFYVGLFYNRIKKKLRGV